jgi:hypothetical protein
MFAAKMATLVVRPSRVNTSARPSNASMGTSCGDSRPGRPTRRATGISGTP